MSVWAQQRVFAERVKDFCRQKGLLTKRGAVQMDVLANMFNISEDVLRRFLQDSTRKRPHLNTLTYMASVLNCSVLEFLDTPNNPPPTVSPEHWAGMTEEERAIVTSLIAEFFTDDLSLAEKQVLYKTFRDVKERMLGLREAWKASASKDG
jgi:transcriptional regulator with XRE-family HTH domain